MRIVVNFDLCASTGACTQVAPEIFEIKSDGYLYINVEEPTGELEAKAREAAELCPTAAISIEE